MDTIAYGLTLLLLLLLPFEVIRPVFSVGGLQITNLEILLAITLAAGIVNGLAQRRWLSNQNGIRFLFWPATTLFIIALISSLLAPIEQQPALKSTLRLGAGILLMGVVGQQSTRPGRFTPLVWVIVVGAAVSAVFGLLERAALPVLDPLFLLFKEQASFVGAEIRISGSFQYATIAAMYWEMALPLALALAATSRQARSRWIALGVAFLLITAIVFTLTRAGLLVLGCLLAGLFILARIQSRFRPFGRPAGITLVYLMGLVVVLGIANPSFRVRLITENDAAWFGAEYVAPEILALTSGSSLVSRVTVTNTGKVNWPATGRHPFVLGYRWLSKDGSQVYDLPLATIPLPDDVLPGEMVILSATVTAPLPAGTYRLSWGIHQKEVLSLYSRGVLEGETMVTVRPGTVALAVPDTIPISAQEQAGQGTKIVSRRELWLAAWRMGGDRPLWGHGLNNFRLLYGTYIGQETWDMRNSANNLYLELFADLGVLGLLSAGWLMVTVIGLLWKAPRSIWVLGLSFSLVALFIHGLLDYFFEFLGVLLFFWAFLGFIPTLNQSESG